MVHQIQKLQWREKKKKNANTSVLYRTYAVWNWLLYGEDNDYENKWWQVVQTMSKFFSTLYKVFSFLGGARIHIHLFVVGSCATYEVQRCTCSSACDGLDKQTKTITYVFGKGGGEQTMDDKT